MKRFFPAVLAALILCAFAYAKADTRYALETEPATFIVRVGPDYYNLVDVDGNVIEEQFVTYVYKYNNGIFKVMRGGLYGFLGSDGEWLIYPQFSWTDGIYGGMILVKKSGLYGYVTGDASEIIPCEYEYAKDFRHGYAAVKQNGKWGYINTRGEMIAEPRFDEADYFNENGHAYVAVNGCACVIDTSGHYLCQPEYGYTLSKSHIIKQESGRTLYGYLYEDGTVIEPRFAERIRQFSEGLAIATEDGVLWGYIDKYGNMVIEPRFDAASYFFYNGMAIVIENGLYGIIDTTGKYLCPPVYDYIYGGYYYSYLNGMYIVEADEKQRAWKTDGTIWKNGYEDIGPCHDGMFKVEENGLCGLADMDGNIVLKPEYTEVYYFTSEYAVVTHEEVDINAWMGSGEAANSIIVDLAGEVLWDEVFDDVFLCDDGTVMADRDGSRRSFTIENGTMTEISTITNSLELTDYAPFEGCKNAAGTLRVDIGFNEWYPIPRLDGATALFPVYAAYAQTVYPADTRYTAYNDWVGTGAYYPLITCSKTDRAYENLIDGETDVIFCAGPSDEEIILAKENGAELVLTPIGYEAFVFIVPGDSPVDSLSTEDIINIYSGAYTDWAQLGFPEGGEIIAYQRPKNSGSQTALENIMGDIKLMKAPQYTVDDMTMIVENVEYRNLTGAIGYSFRFFVSGMLESEVKMLEIDGIAPTVENIRNGSYPFITPIYAIVLKDNDNMNTQILIDWLSTDTAKKLLEAAGYVAY